MQEQRVIRRRSTNSISLTTDEKFNLVTSYGTITVGAEPEGGREGIYPPNFTLSMIFII